MYFESEVRDVQSDYSVFEQKGSRWCTIESCAPRKTEQTYKGTANTSGEVEIRKVKIGNYDVYVNAMRNPDTGEKESHRGLGRSVKGGDQVLQNLP